MSGAAPWSPLELSNFDFDVDICTTFNIFIFESTNSKLRYYYNTDNMNIDSVQLKLGRLDLCYQKPGEGFTDKCLRPNFRSKHPFTISFHSIDVKILEL